MDSQMSCRESGTTSCNFVRPDSLAHFCKIKIKEITNKERLSLTKELNS